MIRPHFRVVIVDLSARKTRVENLPGREQWLGGSGLAALCFEKYADPALPWNDPAQPLIFAIGPLTGYFPLMSKTVCAFLSPYHGQYAESHAGGRSALALRFADMDALVVVGRAERPCVLSIGHKHMEIKDAPFLWGKDVFTTGKMLRNMLSGSARAASCASAGRGKRLRLRLHQRGHVPPLRPPGRGRGNGRKEPQGHRHPGRRLLPPARGQGVRQGLQGHLRPAHRNQHDEQVP
jgi:aldehyde:ferredoxin oxidoreductase